MKINETIKDLWKNDYFNVHRSPNDVKSELFNKHGITCSNITMQLKSCKSFLRKETKGWIQKTRYDVAEPSKKVDNFKLFQIHPEIESVSKKLFLDGHYSQAIFEAFKRVNNLVKEKAGRKDLDGKSLMQNVFSVNNPVLKFNSLSTQSDKDEQEGFMYLFSGAMLGIRNPKGHENIIQNNKSKALEYLVFASLLCRRLEETKK